MFKSTREVAAVLGVSPSRLNRAVWEGRLVEPARGPSGSFLWSEADIRRAAWTLLHRDLDDVLAEQPEAQSAATPPLKLDEQEAAIRRAVKDEIAARYGFTNWSDAPEEALRQYQRFLRKRAEAQR